MPEYMLWLFVAVPLFLFAFAPYWLGILGALWKPPHKSTPWKDRVGPAAGILAFWVALPVALYVVIEAI